MKVFRLLKIVFNTLIGFRTGGLFVSTIISEKAETFLGPSHSILAEQVHSTNKRNLYFAFASKPDQDEVKPDMING